MQSLNIAGVIPEMGKARKPLAVCKASFTIESGFLFGRKKAATSCPHGLYPTKIGGIKVCKPCLPGSILKGAPARRPSMATDTNQVLMATSAVHYEQLQSLAEMSFVLMVISCCNATQGPAQQVWLSGGKPRGLVGWHEPLSSYLT
jgi:hypothetical protein